MGCCFCWRLVLLIWVFGWFKLRREQSYNALSRRMALKLALERERPDHSWIVLFERVRTSIMHVLIQEND